MDISVDLVLQLAVLLVGLLVAWMVRKGWIDRKTVEDTKDIATAATAGIDKLKEFDRDAANIALREVVSKIGDKKGILDDFLKAMNLNKPTEVETGGSNGSGKGDQSGG